MKSRLVTVLLLSIFLIFAFLRFYQIDMRLGFAWDQEQFSTQVRDIVRDHKLTLLGPRVTDENGFFLAPYFTYLLVPFYMSTNLHPRALIPFLITINTVFFFASYFVIAKLWSSKHALFFLAFWALNPVLIKFDTIAWWPLLIPLGVVCTWYIVELNINKPTRFVSLALGALIGFFTNMHFQFIFLGLFVTTTLIFFYQKKLLFLSGMLCNIFIGFMSMFLPLLLFDLRHDFLNFHLFLNFFTHQTSSLPSDIQWPVVLSNTLAPITSMKGYVSGTACLAFTVFSASYLSGQRMEKKSWNIGVIVLLIGTVILFSVYKRRPSEYYFLYLYPFILITLIDTALRTKHTILLFIFILLMPITQLKEIAEVLREDDGGLYYRDQAIRKMLPYSEKKPYAISLDMPAGTANGYRYLIEHYGMHMENTDPKAALIQIRIPAKKGDITIKQLGIAIPSELMKD